MEFGFFMELEKKVIRDESINLESSNKEVIYSESEKERKFTKEEYLGIMEGAEFLREFEARKGKMSQDMVSRLSLNETEVPLSRVYRLAEDLGIDKQYVNKYLEMRFPSEEQKLEDLNKYHATPDFIIMQRSYINILKSILENALPDAKFIFKYSESINMGFINVLMLENKIKKSLIFRKNKIVKKKKKIASTNNFVKWDLYDSCFLRFCGENLDKLNSFYDKKPTMIYHYDVDLLK